MHLEVDYGGARDGLRAIIILAVLATFWALSIHWAKDDGYWKGWCDGMDHAKEMVERKAEELKGGGE